MVEHTADTRAGSGVVRKGWSVRSRQTSVQVPALLLASQQVVI